LVFGHSSRLCIDVKGRRFPGGSPDHPRRVWECWSFREDVDGLDRWARLAGEDYRGLLVFAYLLHPSVVFPASTPDLFEFRDDRYLFRAVDVEDYRQYMTTAARDGERYRYRQHLIEGWSGRLATIHVRKSGS
jgi:hypothetical protein